VLIVRLDWELYLGGAHSSLNLTRSDRVPGLVFLAREMITAIGIYHLRHLFYHSMPKFL
jgi:hypothetical protein